MYNKTDKRRLYWLIEQFLLSKIDETMFCNEFHDSFVNEMDYGLLTDFEFDTFRDLSNICQRFSEYEEDFNLWSGFVTAKQLREQVLETKKKLQEQSPI